MSHRGIELFDGRFNLVSELIDDYVKGLKQLLVDEFSWEQTTQVDWAAGSSIGVDTTTLSGSINPFER